MLLFFSVLHLNRDIERLALSIAFADPIDQI